MERIVYCQDDLYVNDLNFVKAEDTTKVVNGKELQVGFVSKQEPSFVQEMVSHTKAYFNVSIQTMTQQFFCTLNAIAYTPCPDLAVASMSLSCNTTTMQGIVARRYKCLIQVHAQLLYKLIGASDQWWKCEGRAGLMGCVSTVTGEK